MGIGKLAEGSRNTPRRFMLQKPKISADLMDHLVGMQTILIDGHLPGKVLSI